MSQELKNEVLVTLNREPFNFFSIKTDSFCKDIVDICKSTRCREYNYEQKTWSLPLECYDVFFKKISSLQNLKIVKQISKQQLNKVEIVMIEENENEFLFTCTKNKEIEIMIKNFCGFFYKTRNCWLIRKVYQQEFFDRIKNLKIEVLQIKDKLMRKLF